MRSSDWGEIKAAFITAMDLAGDDRSQFIDGCDETIRAEVEKLIAADGHADGFIDEPAIVRVGLAADNVQDDYVGKKIDEYEIVGEIGRGGMGSVYRAKRTDRTFNKVFALKLVKRGMDTDAVLRRFVVERR